MWRSVECLYCGILVSKTETTVHRESYRLALQRQQSKATHSGEILICNKQSFVLKRTLLTLVDGTRYVLGHRVGAAPIQVLLKIGEKSKCRDLFQAEAGTLGYFHSLKGALAGHYSRMIPSLIEFGDATEQYSDRSIIVLSLIPGIWGSLSAVIARQTGGVDARHAVWMWRRLLDILSYVHSVGWSHSAVNPESAWLNPQDHGVFLMDWSQAKPNSEDISRASDVQHSARVIRVLLSGALDRKIDSLNVPTELKRLLNSVCDDTAFCEQHGANGIDALIVQAAEKVFGSPKFIEFHP
jgi:serine/threonine protein kinase